MFVWQLMNLLNHMLFCCLQEGGSVREAESSSCGVDETTGQCTPADSSQQPTAHRHRVSFHKVVCIC